MSDLKYLTDKATRQEHLSELLDWISARVTIWAREYKQHKAEQDRAELRAHESTVKLLKGYLDSFTKDIVTDVEEPKIEREKLADVDTRYNHVVTLMEMWRDAAEFIRNEYVGKITTPTPALTKIKMFEKAVDIVRTYEETLAGVFKSGARQYPAYRDGMPRVLKSCLDEAGKAGVMANKKRLLDEANEVEAKTEVPKEEDDDKVLSDTAGATGGSQDPEDEAGYALN